MVTRTVTLAAGVVWASLLAFGLTTGPAWADAAFMRVTGTTFIAGDQVDIKIPGSRDAITVLSTQFNVSNPPGQLPGQVSIPRAGPVTVTKRFERSTPRLMQAAFTGESLTVEIVWWMLDGAGQTRPTTRVMLEGARITNLGAAASLTNSSASASEEVEFIYRKITLIVPILDIKGVQIGSNSVCLDVERGSTC